MAEADPDIPILYSFRRCPYAMRARLAMHTANIQCELREVLLRDKPAEMLAASAKGTVPVLIDVGGRVIDESLDVMQWALAQRDPAGWLIPEVGSRRDMAALIATCDEQFKSDLDRYKYANRYDNVDPLAHRDTGSQYLYELQDRLSRHAYLFGERPSLADMAIVPFVRQFAHTDIRWFEAQPWETLNRWLMRIIGSDLFNAVMHKYPRWVPGRRGEVFPPAS